MEFAYELAATYPNLVSVSSAGQSYEGREVRNLFFIINSNLVNYTHCGSNLKWVYLYIQMVLMKISSGGDGTKNAIFVDAGDTIENQEYVNLIITNTSA